MPSEEKKIDIYAEEKIFLIDYLNQIYNVIKKEDVDLRVIIRQTKSNEAVVIVTIHGTVLFELYFPWKNRYEMNELIKFFIRTLKNDVNQLNNAHIIILDEDMLNDSLVNFLKKHQEIMCMFEYVGNLQEHIYFKHSRYGLQYAHYIVFPKIDDPTALSFYMESAYGYFTHLKRIGYTYSFEVYNEQLLDFILNQLSNQSSNQTLYVYNIEVIGVEFKDNKRLQIGDCFEVRFILCNFGNCLISKLSQRTNIKHTNCKGSFTCV